ncbi:MAG: sigma factor, partial [Bacteroidota bacterium]
MKNEGSKKFATLDDLTLIRVYLSGPMSHLGNNAFGVLYNRHIQMVKSQCYRILKNSSQSEDIAQEVFVAFRERLLRKDLSSIENPRAYLKICSRSRSLKNL